jgi:chromosome segregation ATPase
MGFMEVLLLIILAGIVGDTLTKVVKGRRPADPEVPRLRGEIEELQRQLEEQAAGLADHDRQLLELQERVDFAERMLAQSRDRPGLPGPSAGA